MDGHENTDRGYHGRGRDDRSCPPEPSLPPVPEELEYLLESAIRYGREYKFDDGVQRFLQNGRESDFENLAALAEHARLSEDYLRLMNWMDEVDDVVERIVDTRIPYSVVVSDERRRQYLKLVNPNLPANRREKCVRESAEADDPSPLAKRRSDLRDRLLIEANDIVHHMDLYFLFGLMDACDMTFE
jgi:hypothetical protein